MTVRILGREAFKMEILPYMSRSEICLGLSAIKRRAAGPYLNTRNKKILALGNSRGGGRKSPRGPFGLLVKCPRFPPLQTNADPT